MNKKNQDETNKESCKKKQKQDRDSTKNKFSRYKKLKLHLTRFRDCKLVFPITAAAIDSAPSSQIWFQPCTAHVGALTQSNIQQAENIYSRNRTGKTRTRCRLFTLLISPVFTRAVNKARSAAGTAQLAALTNSEPTSNTPPPKCTFAMEYAAATRASAGLV